MKYFKFKFLIVAITVLIVSFSLSASKVSASTGDNVSGYAWSSNIGWIRFNNCTNPLDSTTCGTTNYGVTVTPTAPGTISGYAWSSNIGWISFDPASVAGCIPAPDGMCQAHVDWSAAGNSKPIRGWARACTVFQSGCSGTLKPQDARGGWDGWISMSGSAGYGVTLDTSTKKISGFAWGDEVIGWIKFTGVTYEPNTPWVTLSANPATVSTGGASTLTWNSSGMSSCTGSKVSGGGSAFNTSSATSGNATVTIPSDTTYKVTCNVITGGTKEATTTVTVDTSLTLGFSQPFASGGCVNALGMNPQLTWTAQAATSCTLSRGSANESVGPSAQASGGTQQGGIYYYTPNLSVNANPTQYGLTCTDGTNTVTATPVTVSVCATPQPDFSVSGSPANQPFTDGAIGGPYEGLKVATFTVVTKGILGYTDDVSLSATKGAAMPASAIVTAVSPALVHETGSGAYESATFTVTMSAADFAANPRGAWPITIKGTSSGKVRTGNVIVGAKVKPIYIEH